MPTLQKLMKYKDMNSNREELILINPYQSLILQKLQNSSSNWKLPVLWLVDSTCTLHASLTINSCYLLEGPGGAKLSKMKGQFSFSHLHLFLTIVKESLLFYKQLSGFLSLLKVSFILVISFHYHGWNHPHSTWIFHTALPWARS